MNTQCRDLSAQAQVAGQPGWRSPVLSKRVAMTAIAASLAFATPAFAEDAHHPEQAQETGAAPAESAAEAAKTVQKMQDNVKKMPAQLDRIAAAKTDEERQKAMAEHMRTMQENMKMAGGMMGCPMMGGGMMGKGGMGMMGGGAQPGGSPERMQQMEKCMDMMQMMGRQEGQQPMPMK